MKLWGGNYESSPDAAFWEFNRSFPFDRRLIVEEVAASRAWVRALGRCGAIRADESAEGAIAADLKTKADVMKFVEKSWNAGNAAIAAITDQHLSATVSTPWNMSLPGWMMMGITNDEYLHHRGQLYCFARLLGKEPPMIWDFEHNAEAFRPRQMTA